MDQIKDVFKSMQVPEKLLAEITNHLQKSNEIEQEIHKIEMEKLDKRALEIDEEINNLIRKSIKKGNTMDDKYERIEKELEKEQFELNIRREELQNADKSALKPI